MAAYVFRAPGYRSLAQALTVVWVCFFLRDERPPGGPHLSHRIPCDLVQVVLTLQALFSADKSWLLFSCENWGRECF